MFFFSHEEKTREKKKTREKTARPDGKPCRPSLARNLGSRRELIDELIDAHLQRSPQPLEVAFSDGTYNTLLYSACGISNDHLKKRGIQRNFGKRKKKPAGSYDLLRSAFSKAFIL